MKKVTLRKLKPADKKYFAKWWRDKDFEKCGFEKGEIIEYSENKFLPKTLRMELVSLKIA